MSNSPDQHVSSVSGDSPKTSKQTDSHDVSKPSQESSLEGEIDDAVLYPGTEYVQKGYQANIKALVARETALARIDEQHLNLVALDELKRIGTEEDGYMFVVAMKEMLEKRIAELAAVREKK